MYVCVCVQKVSACTYLHVALPEICAFVHSKGGEHLVYVCVYAGKYVNAWWGGGGALHSCVRADGLYLHMYVCCTAKGVCVCAVCVHAGCQHTYLCVSSLCVHVCV